jgi:hypothetical protein
MLQFNDANTLLKAGYPTSYIDKGDIVPLTFGETYEFGRIVPSDEVFTVLRLLEVDSAKLFFSRTLDIYDEEGFLSEEKIKNIDMPKEFKQHFDIEVIGEVPKFALIDVFAVFEVIKNLVLFSRIKKIRFVNHFDMEETLKRVAITGIYTEDGKNFEFIIYQPYHNYMIAPVVKHVAGTDYGLSLASLSTAKTAIKALYRRSAVVFQEQIIKFLNVAGWKRREAIEDEELEDYVRSFSGSSWFYRKDVPRISVLSAYSPEEDFVETMTYYYMHRFYLKEAFPERFKICAELDELINRSL